LIRCFAIVFGELPDDPDLSFGGTLSIITTLEFLQHLFSEMGHGDLLVTHTIGESTLAKMLGYPHA
jgi:hypothetical protein